MDSLTHIVTGACIPIVSKRSPKLFLTVIFGAIAGSFPDIDAFFSLYSPETMIEYHRGYSHALVLQPLFAAVLAGIFLFLYKKVGNKQGFSNYISSEITFFWLFKIALCGLFLHIFLDAMTTFGTQIFLPFSNIRVGLPSLFIVDPLYTLVITALLCLALYQNGVEGNVLIGDFRAITRYSNKAIKYAKIALIWTIVYPMLTLGINSFIGGYYAHKFFVAKQNVHVLPEPFSPFVWKVAIEKDDTYNLFVTSVFNLSTKHEPIVFLKKDSENYRTISNNIKLFDLFEQFSSLMIQKKLINADSTTTYSYQDIRYIMLPYGVASFFNRTDGMFILEAKVNKNNNLIAYRFLNRGRDIDTPWIFISNN